LFSCTSGESAAAEFAGALLDGTEKPAPDPKAAMLVDDEIVRHVDERARGKGREAAEADGETNRPAAEVGEKNESRRVLSQTGNHVAPGYLRKWFAVAHRIHRIGVEEVKRRRLMLGPREVSFDHSDLSLIHEMHVETWPCFLRMVGMLFDAKLSK
jgi:hypothetical protein